LQFVFTGDLSTPKALLRETQLDDDGGGGFLPSIQGLALQGALSPPAALP
jgi:hypothetical protein